MAYDTVMDFFNSIPEALVFKGVPYCNAVLRDNTRLRLVMNFGNGYSGFIENVDHLGLFTHLMRLDKSNISSWDERAEYYENQNSIENPMYLKSDLEMDCFCNIKLPKNVQVGFELIPESVRREIEENIPDELSYENNKIDDDDDFGYNMGFEIKKKEPTAFDETVADYLKTAITVGEIERNLMGKLAARFKSDEELEVFLNVLEIVPETEATNFIRAIDIDENDFAEKHAAEVVQMCHDALELDRVKGVQSMIDQEIKYNESLRRQEEAITANNNWAELIYLEEEEEEEESNSVASMLANASKAFGRVKLEQKMINDEIKNKNKKRRRRGNRGKGGVKP
jgi:hypothetical protein